MFSTTDVIGSTLSVVDFVHHLDPPEDVVQFAFQFRDFVVGNPDAGKPGNAAHCCLVNRHGLKYSNSMAEQSGRDTIVMLWLQCLLA